MSNIFGKIFKISTYGESHGKAIGVIIDGCPSGIEINEKDIQLELNRRKPGQSKITTQRNESDSVEILSGVFNGKTTGSPISLFIKTKTRKAVITIILQLYLDPHMLIIHIIKNMKIEILGVEAGVQLGKQQTG